MKDRFTFCCIAIVDFSAMDGADCCLASLFVTSKKSIDAAGCSVNK
jgi:hypothetical protein